MSISFHHHDFTITYAGETRQFLRKEFALLQYLYQHANQAFTRDQLLEAVWPLEFPSDRTVDDHVYRLRKKLKGWEHVLTVETVKGYGYKLVIHINEPKSLLSHDPEFKQLTMNLFSKYHLYGHGNALNTLTTQNELGVEFEDMKIYLSYMRGDIWECVHSNELAFSDKALYLFFIYTFITTKKDKVIDYLEKALDQKVFSELTVEEATILLPTMIYILTDHLDRAHRQLTFAENQITDENHGFYPFHQLIRMMYSLSTGNDECFIEKKKHMDEFFKHKPLQRELGIFYLIKGLFLIKKQQYEMGQEDIYKGLQITQQTQFKSHIMLFHRLCLFYLEHYIEDSKLETEFRKNWNQMAMEYDFRKLEQEIEKQIKQNLYI
ncbi:winged helix-turn-helix domain-containing protein [Piscibacillus halophilus]|uniref:winged helix-turn-helix domain-containing protein n=1 Tax=Piscibacillus halophilus TaxID=571933 RepID=UPI00158CB206|nr:helix-turn-helix domain-containing protein [Piscibacillus halophilus]